MGEIIRKRGKNRTINRHVRVKPHNRITIKNQARQEVLHALTPELSLPIPQKRKHSPVHSTTWTETLKFRTVKPGARMDVRARMLPAVPARTQIHTQGGFPVELIRGPRTARPTVRFSVRPKRRL